MVKIKGQPNGRKKRAAPRPQKKKGQTGQRKSSRVPNDLSTNPYALARLDPWSPGAKGAKVPDFDNNPSCSGDFTFEVNFITDANGRVSAVLPFWPSCTFKAAPWSAANSRYELTGVSNVLAQQGAFFSGWDECVGLRIVGGGVKLKTPLNANNVSGKVFIASMSVAEMKGWASAGATGGMADADFSNRKYVEKRELSDLLASGGTKAVMSVLDPSGFTYYEPGVDPLTAAVDNGDFGNYLGFAIAVIGAPASTTVLEASCTVHYEWLPGKTYNWMATAPEPANTGLLERVNNIAERTPKILDNIGNIASNVYSAVKTGLSIAGTIGLL